MEADYEDFLLRQEIHTRHRLLDLQHARALARRNVPEPAIARQHSSSLTARKKNIPDGLVVATADEPLAAQQQSRAVVCVAVEEANALRNGMLEVRLAMMQ